MLPIHQTRYSVYSYASIPPGYYFEKMLHGGASQRFWHRQKFEAVAERVRQGDAVIDFGCGPGSFLWVLQQREPSVRALGIDFARAQLEYACSRLGAAALRPGEQWPGLPEVGREQNTERLRVAELSAEAPGFPVEAASVDVVTLIEVIEHVHPMWALRTLQEARRVLKPAAQGGRLLVTTPNYRSLWPLIEWLLERVSPIKYHDQHINPLTPNSLLKLVEAAGFEVRSVSSLFVVAPFLAPLSEWLARVTQRFERRLPGLLGSLLILEAVPLPEAATAREHPSSG